MKVWDVGLSGARSSQPKYERGSERESEGEREGALVQALLLLESGASCANGYKKKMFLQPGELSCQTERLSEVKDSLSV